MKRELRGIMAGDWFEDDCVLRVYRNDRGMHVVHADIEANIFYHWLISPDGNVTALEIGSAFEYEVE